MDLLVELQRHYALVESTLLRQEIDSTPPKDLTKAPFEDIQARAGDRIENLKRLILANVPEDDSEPSQKKAKTADSGRKSTKPEVSKPQMQEWVNNETVWSIQFVVISVYKVRVH